MTLTGNLTLPHRAANVSAARHSLASALSGAGIAEGSVDDAVLVLSELVGNALRHADPLPPDGIAIRWRVASARLVVEVTDGGSKTWPCVTEASPGAPSGRGLHIVDTLALDWGVRSERDGARTVWASLPAPRRSERGRRRTRHATQELGDEPKDGERSLSGGGGQLVR